ncbi:MAG: acetate kinase [Elusimicrobiota bacterium]|nr:acetate kinase [Elusimicrobiota bacterium]
MRINLILNCGSSSLKYKVFKSGTKLCLTSGLIERIGAPDAVITHKVCNGKAMEKITGEVKNHSDAISTVLDRIRGKGGFNKKQLKAVGHRVVHGGKYSAPVVVNKNVKKYLKAVTFELAPLHNPFNYEGIIAAEKSLPGVTNVAVFDTAFHQTIPDFAYMYALPYRYYTKYLVRKYGFHGTSHQYVSILAAKMLKKPLSKTKLVTCHLGNGASLAAVKSGKCVDTSMGYTPLEGVMMGTRSGDIDPAAVLHLMMEEELSLHDMDTILNKQSGLMGVSGISNDMRDIIKASAAGNKRAALAFKMYCHRIKKYIGAYITLLNGVDAVVFTAGLGENSYPTRAEVLKNMQNIGIIIDPVLNKGMVAGQEGEINAPSSPVKVFVIATDEELMISRLADKMT